jgi:hypothetical protein
VRVRLRRTVVECRFSIAPDRHDLAIRYSPAVTMAAMALCSAQNPVPQPVSIQTPA